MLGTFQPLGVQGKPEGVSPRGCDCPFPASSSLAVFLKRPAWLPRVFPVAFCSLSHLNGSVSLCINRLIYLLIIFSYPRFFQSFFHIVLMITVTSFASPLLLGLQRNCQVKKHNEKSLEKMFKRVWRRCDSSAKYFLTVFTFDQSCIAKPFKCTFIKEKKCGL